MTEMNDRQTPVTDELLSMYPPEVGESLMEALATRPYVRNLVSKGRRRAKDMPRDGRGRVVVDFENPHILEGMDYFRPAARRFEETGRYTDLRPNGSPNSEYGRWLREERRRCWEGYVREEDGEWVTGYLYWYLNYCPIMLVKMADDGTYLAAFDDAGNIRVVRVYWKSRKKVLKVKSYDEVTGETVWTLYPEGHEVDRAKGEEAEELWVNEAWEGTRIGDEVYVDIRPMPVQFARLSNPSRCHFGIIGSLYSLGGDRPFSLVDMMKPYNYMYDVIHDRLNRLIAKNWGNLLELDLASLPQGFDIEKWMYYARESNLVIKNSFSEGSGAARGKLAGGLNNNGKGVIPFEMGQTINSYVSYLEYLKKEMSEVVGISPQREGAISNRETVGGVERATVQSAHITEWLFSIHNDVKRRVYEAFLEVAKAALRGQSRKFSHILSDNSLSVVDIDGDEFAECDYGLSVDCSNEAQALKQSIETLAQAALQTQALSFSGIMRLYSSSSLAEKQRMVEKAEQDALRRQEQAAQRQQQMAQQQLQAQQQTAQAQMQAEERARREENETRIRVAQIEAMTKYETTQREDPRQFDESMAEKRRQFDERLGLDRERLDLQRKAQADGSDAARRKAESDERRADADRSQRRGLRP